MGMAAIMVLYAFCVQNGVFFIQNARKAGNLVALAGCEFTVSGKIHREKSISIALGREKRGNFCTIRDC